jgi:quercetin dioxygenase-like cupin family protein
MDTHMKYSRALLIAIGSLLAVASTSADRGTAASDAVVKSLLTRELPELPNKEVTMLTVEYAPGGASPPHKHQAHTFVYVLEGAIVMQVKGGKETRLSAGETFYESPADIHTVSRNASDTERAKFLVFFVKERDAPASMPVDE